MGCISITSFVVLINGEASPFFKAERGLRQGCPLSPLIFLLVVEGLSRFLTYAVKRGDLTGLELAPSLHLTHLLFVDDILLFCNGSRRDINYLQRGITLFKVATGMKINLQKSTLSLIHLREPDRRYISNIFPVPTTKLSDGLKYLEFYLKPNDYQKIDLEMVNWKDGKEVTGVEQQVALKGRPTDHGKISSGGHPGILDVHRMDSKGHLRNTTTHLFYLPLVGSERDSHQAVG